jgi:hypothetical protein
MHKIRFAVVGASLIVWLLFMITSEGVCDLEFKDTVAITAAYMTHLSLHEIGHQVVAEEVGAGYPQISFFTHKNGRFYPGMSTYQSIPKESKLPYAIGGERMASYTFEYALNSFYRKPTTYNKALMFFSCADFVAYTMLANYIHPEEDMYDPNIIRAETGLSKEALLSLVMAKALMNTYRVYNENANFAPMIWVAKDSAALVLRFSF